MKRKLKAKPESKEPTCTITLKNWDGRQIRWRGKPLLVNMGSSTEERERWFSPRRMVEQPLTQITVTFERGTEKCRIST